MTQMAAELPFGAEFQTIGQGHSVFVVVSFLKSVWLLQAVPLTKPPLGRTVAGVLCIFQEGSGLSPVGLVPMIFGDI